MIPKITKLNRKSEIYCDNFKLKSKQDNVRSRVWIAKLKILSIKTDKLLKKSKKINNSLEIK